MGLELASRSNGWEEEVVCKKEGVQGNEILSLVSALRSFWESRGMPYAYVSKERESIDGIHTTNKSQAKGKEKSKQPPHFFT